MADQLDILKRLQAIDAELFRLRKEQREKPLELERVQAQVAAQEERARAAGDRLTALQVSQKEKEIDLQTREGHVKKLQGQLFQVKTNKEYTAMQREIESAKADNSLLEEEILKTFDAIDQALKARQLEQAKVAQEHEHLATQRQRIERELSAIGERIAQLERDRKTMLPDIHGPTLATYERVLQIREGLALVPIVNDACGGCDRRLPPQVVNEVYLKAALVTCEHCSRILYFDEAHSKL
jgi:predicted  nucleic acid-binding Zn-ribbon protein